MKVSDVRNQRNEGWYNVRPINRDRYGEREGLEGPFQTKAGKVVYYDPREGAYYDPDTDMYLTYDEWNALNEGLPPHLAKFIDKDGDWTADAKKRLGKDGVDRLSKTKKKSKDVTPKGYGPDEIEEGWHDDKGSYTSTGTTTYLLRNPEGNEWNLLNYEDTPGSNPQHLRKMIEQRVKRLGWQRGDVVAQWKGDIDDTLDDAQSKLASGKEYIHSYKMELEKKVRDLTKAKEVMAAGEEVQPANTEARDPREVIGNFLKQKEQRSARGKKLYTDREFQQDLAAVKAGKADASAMADKWGERGGAFLNFVREDTKSNKPPSQGQADLAKTVDGFVKAEKSMPGAKTIYHYKNGKRAYFDKIGLAFGWIVIDPDGTRSLAGSLDALEYQITDGQVNEDEPTDSDYAIGMAQAKKSTGDKKPLKKSTIKKAHKIARAVAKESTASGKRMPTHEIMNRIERAMPDLKPYGVKEKVLGIVSDILYKADQGVLEDADPCWKGYRQLGMKKKNGKEVPNCVPESNVKEGVAKIACTKCDEVSTAAAWKKNGGFCPKCKTSSQGVAESGLGTGMKAFRKNASSSKDPRMMKIKLMLSSPEFIESIAKDPKGKPNFGDKAFAIMAKALGIPRENELQRRIAKKLVASGEYKKAVSPKYNTFAYTDDELKDLYQRYIVNGEDPRGDLSLDDVYPQIKRKFAGKQLSGIGWTDDRNVAVKDMDGNEWIYDPITQKVSKMGTNEEKKVGDKVKYRNIKSKRNKSGTIRKVSKDKHGQKRYELEGGKIVYDADLEEAMPSFGKTISISKNGQPAKKLNVQSGKMHHIAQELRKAGLGLKDLEITNAARELSRGKPYSAGNIKITVGEQKPRQFGESTVTENYLPGLPDAKKAKPTRGHRPAIWEQMLGTVYAMNDAGEIKSFGRDYKAAIEFSGAADDHRDPRLHRLNNNYRPSSSSDNYIPKGKLVYWIKK